MSTAPPGEPKPHDMNVVTRCPMCKADTLKHHCTVHTCDWWMCRNETCNATLSATRRIGHCLDPDGTLVKGSSMVARIRLVHDHAGWRKHVEQRDD